jgi:hypothetical protein
MPSFGSVLGRLRTVRWQGGLGRCGGRQAYECGRRVYVRVCYGVGLEHRTVCPLVPSRYDRKLSMLHFPPCTLLYSSPCFWIATLVKCTIMLSMFEPVMLALYFTVVNRQNPCLLMYARKGRYLCVGGGHHAARRLENQQPTAAGHNNQQRLTTTTNSG